ncbi:MAG: peptide chain release factor N(5)-glutamine methyltransferase [Proteobacteria bacterium]|nr:peptide chain release factor N(5)-glutamine methyltransferase [Pseudomonadota bacterium]
MAETIEQALVRAQTLRSGSDSWQLDGELLLAHALEKTREYLHTWPARELEAEQLLAYQESLHRRQQGEPIAYILGKKEFWDFELAVNSRVLIPRPETELLVATALELLAGLNAAVGYACALNIVDLGTGSGAIALALARGNKDWLVTAVDISEPALAIAAANAKSLAVGNIEFRQASWCDGLDAIEYDMIVANPPYVAAGDSHLQQADLKFEPSIALVADEDGLTELRKIVSQSKNFLKKDAWLLLEHGFNQKRDVSRFLQDAGFVNVECKQDFAGLDRLTSGQWPG